MEAFFLDVAQGACQIILTGNQSAIVIDGGTKGGRLPLQFLRRANVDRIAALLTTHSHADHMGGATAILNDYQDQIDLLGFVQDHQFLQTTYWSRISQFISEGVLRANQLTRLERGRNPQRVWFNRVQRAALRVFAPRAWHNLQAQEAESENATCAVVMLDVGSNRIVFASDSEIIEWRDIHEAHGSISCNVLSVPHHGGKIHNSQDDLDWLYQVAIRPDVAIVSVGTSNTYNHPRDDVIRTLTACGATVMCTQITRRCSSNLEVIRASLPPSRHIGASRFATDLTTSGNSRNVACAGTILVEIDKNSARVQSLNAHQTAVDRFPKHPICPLCRLN